MRMFQAHNTNRVSRVRFSPDACTLTVVVRTRSEFVHLDLISGGSQLWEPYGATRPAIDLVYSADGSYIGVAADWAVLPFIRSATSSSSAVGSYHVEPLGELQARVANWQRHSLRCLAFSPNTEPRFLRLAVASRELLLWNPYSQEYIVAPEEGDYRGVSFGPDGTTVTSIEYHAHALCVWNVKPFRTWFRTGLRGIDTFDNGAVAMLPDGERVIYAAGEHLRCVPLTGTGGWETVTKKPPLEIALHPGGRTLLVADGSKKVTAYDTDNGRPATQYDWGIGKVGCVTYSPDGTLAAAGGEKGQVVVWDAE